MNMRFGDVTLGDVKDAEIDLMVAGQAPSSVAIRIADGNGETVVKFRLSAVEAHALAAALKVACS